MGRCGDFKPGAGAADGARQRGDRLLLGDDALVQLLLDAHELLRLFLLDGGDGHAGPAGDDLFDVLLGDHAGRRLVEVVFFAQRAQVLALLALFVGIEARLLELVVGDGVLHAMDDELDALLHVGDLVGQRGLAQLDARARLVEQIDRLVGQEAVGDVAVGVRDRVVDRLLGIGDGVELLVAVLDAVDDLDRVLFVGRRDFDRLEAALERAVFLDRLAVFAGSGGADALDLAAGERRLEDVGGVERTFRRSGADQGMQLIDEDDGVLVLHQLFHDGLEALFELAAILGAGDDQGKIEGEDALFGEERGHLAVGDALRQPLDDRGLAHAGLADEHGIVLGAAAQDLHHALDLVLAADQRVELRVHGRLGEVAGEFGEQRLFALPLLRLFFRGGGLHQLFANGGELQAALLQDLGGKTFLFAQQAEQQVFGADVLVRQPFGLFRGVGEHALALVRERKIDRGRDLLADGGMAFDLLADRFDRCVGTQEPVGKRLVFAEQPEQQVFGLDIGRSELAGLVPREEDDAPRFLCVAFKHKGPQ